MRFKNALIFVLLSTLLLSCNRAVGTNAVVITPAVNTLIAAGTKPAPLEEQISSLPTLEETSVSLATTEIAQSPLPNVTSVPLNKDSLYAVIQLGEMDLLNVRVEPGLSSHVLFTLPSQQRDLKPTGQEQVVDEVTWIEIELPDGATGWVSAQFLTEQVESSTFCQDAQVEALLERLIISVKERDGEALAAMVSPVRGLSLYHNVWNPPVSFDRSEVLQNIYISTVNYDWGIQEGSGLPLVGPFKELVYPKLQDVFSYPHTRHCNVLEQNISAGGTSGLVFWPAEYANLNFVAFYRAAPESQELNWRTWVAGIEYINGIPYIAVLIQFYWEI